MYCARLCVGGQSYLSNVAKVDDTLRVFVQSYSTYLSNLIHTCPTFQSTGVLVHNSNALQLRVMNSYTSWPSMRQAGERCKVTVFSDQAQLAALETCNTARSRTSADQVRMEIQEMLHQWK